MKAMLVTLCGCSRMVDVPDGAHQWVVPIQDTVKLGYFHDPGTERFSEWGNPRRRLFVLDRDPFQMCNGVVVALFREKETT